METRDVVVLEYHNYDIIINLKKNMIGVIWLTFVSAWLFAVCVDNSSTVHGQGGIRPLVEQGLVAGKWNFVRLFINKV